MEPSDAVNPIDERSRVEALAAFAPRFRQPDATPGEWVDRKSPVRIEVKPSEHVREDARGIWFDPSDLLSDFTKMAYETGWVVSSDWNGWSRTPEGNSLLNDRSAVAAASPEQLSKLLTAIIRADRFSEGTMEKAFESGLLLTIAERATIILQNGNYG